LPWAVLLVLPVPVLWDPVLVLLPVPVLWGPVLAVVPALPVLSVLGVVSLVQLLARPGLVFLLHLSYSITLDNIEINL